MSQIEKVVIIGSGPAACTAAIYAARAQLDPVMIVGKEEGGQLASTPEVGNWPGAVGDPSGFDLMQNMLKHVKALNVRMIRASVKSVDFSKEVKLLDLGSKGSIESYAVIIATGAQARYLGLENEEQFKGRGISACATCDGFFFKGKTVAVIGGGSVAFIEALFLAHLCKKVYIIHRREGFRAEQVLVDRVNKLVEEGKIELRLNVKVAAYHGDERLSSIDLDTAGVIENLELDGVFVAIGHAPATEIFKGQIELDDHGYIVTHPELVPATATSCPGVFAAGDCSFPYYHQAVVAAGTGCKAALDAEGYVLNVLSRN